MPLVYKTTTSQCYIDRFANFSRFTVDYLCKLRLEVNERSVAVYIDSAINAFAFYASWRIVISEDWNGLYMDLKKVT